MNVQKILKEEYLLNISIWYILPQFFVLFPAAVSCYLPAKNQMKYTPVKTAILCIAVLVPYSFFGAWLHCARQIDTNTILLFSLIIFFFLYRHTVKLDLPKSLSIYIGVCAIETFPAQFAYAFDAGLHPLSNASEFSVTAAFFQFALSCLLLAAFIFPACHQFSWTIDHLNYPKIWYATLILSSVFLIFNIIAIPHSYSTLHTGRMFWLFPTLEVFMMTLLIAIYVLFYQGTIVILEHSRLKEHSQLLEMQANQYRILQEHIQQTKRLRHDFRHSVHLLASLAEKGDLENIQAYLAEYEDRLTENVLVNYCNNAALNALFSYYHEMAVSNKITINWKIELPEPLTISELDLASLFGNLMENAITGCLGTSKEERYFSLITKIHHGNSLYVVSTNSFDGQVRKGKDGYHSTKHSGKGIGLASITAIAEKYHGSVRISNSDKEFFVDVVIKL